MHATGNVGDAANNEPNEASCEAVEKADNKSENLENLGDNF